MSMERHECLLLSYSSIYDFVLLCLVLFALYLVQFTLVSRIVSDVFASDAP